MDDYNSAIKVGHAVPISNTQREAGRDLYSEMVKRGISHQSAIKMLNTLRFDYNAMYSLYLMFRSGIL